MIQQVPRHAHAGEGEDAHHHPGKTTEFGGSYRYLYFCTYIRNPFLQDSRVTDVQPHAKTTMTHAPRRPLLTQDTRAKQHLDCGWKCCFNYATAF
eukprot:scaffold23017_cov177-Skeletonema_dohrnii-CCMP3373.AAC.3